MSLFITIVLACVAVALVFANRLDDNPLSTMEDKEETVEYNEDLYDQLYDDIYDKY